MTKRPPVIYSARYAQTPEIGQRKGLQSVNVNRYPWPRGGGRSPYQYLETERIAGMNGKSPAPRPGETTLSHVHPGSRANIVLWPNIANFFISLQRLIVQIFSRFFSLRINYLHRNLTAKVLFIFLILFMKRRYIEMKFDSFGLLNRHCNGSLEPWVVIATKCIFILGTRKRFSHFSLFQSRMRV
jgi:hypothetical protein